MLVGSRSNDLDGHALKVADLSRPVRKMLLDDNVKVNTESVRGVLENLDEMLARAEIDDFPQVLLKSDGWILEDPALIRLFERLMNQGTPLGDFVKGRIYRGVVTGLNKAFEIDQDRCDELIEDDPRSAEIIKPWLRGRDIKRWRAESTGLYLIFTRRGVEIARYPAIKEHLSWWHSDLEPKATSGQSGPGRKPGDYQWYEIQDSTAYYHEFAHPKIVWPDIAQEAQFAYDTTGSYLGNTAYAMPTQEMWLLAVLNSSLTGSLLCQLTNPLRGGYLRLIHQYVSQVPIVTPDAGAQAKLESLTNEILDLEDSPEEVEGIEREIDAIVFHAYGLSAPERKLVLDWLGERREALGAEMPPNWRKLNTVWATAGAWRDTIDAEQFLEDIRISRSINTRPEPRL